VEPGGVFILAFVVSQQCTALFDAVTMAANQDPVFTSATMRTTAAALL